MTAINKTRLAVWTLIVLAISLAAFAYVRIAPGVVDTKEARAQQQLLVLEAALERFKADHGRYPSQEEGLRALMDASSPRGGYLSGEFALKDPWMHQWVFRERDVKGPPQIYSIGPNGSDEGGRRGDDVSPPH